MRKKTIDTIPILSERISDILNTFSQSRSLPASLVKRSQIILRSAKGETNQKIAVTVGLHYVNVATWRTRFLQNLPNLRKLESSAPEKLSSEIVNILSDKKRPGHPSTFTPEQRMEIINLACRDPKEYGYEVSQWSLSLLVKEIIKSGIAEHISEKTVSRFLK